MSEPSTMKVQIVGTGYLTTKQGACKVVQMVFSLLAALLTQIGFKGFLIDIFITLAYISFLLATILFIIYMTAIVEHSEIPLNRMQFLFHSIWAIVYLIAACFLLYFGSNNLRLIIGTSFGCVAILGHVIDALDNYKKHPFRCSCKCKRKRQDLLMETAHETSGLSEEDTENAEKTP